MAGEQQTNDTKPAQVAAEAAETPKDDFTAVFDALNKLGDREVPADLTSKPDEAAATVAEIIEQEANPPAKKPAAAAAAAETPAADDELPADDKAKEAEAATAAAEAAEAAKRDKKPDTQLDDSDILRRLGQLIQQPPAQPQPQRQQPQTPVIDFTAEEKELVAEYEKEWPDVARAEAVKRSVEYKLLTNHIFTEVMKIVSPLFEGQRALLDRTQLQDLQATVENYDEKLVNDVAEWVKKQPAYLQPAYLHVMEQGTVDEVKDLVDRYRASTGTPAPKTEGEPEKKPSGSELPTPAKQAAARLAPVSTKRTAPVAQVSSGDFDSAFAEALKNA